MPKSLVNRIRLVYLPFDLVFGVLIPLAVVKGLEPRDSSWAFIMLYALSLGRSAAILIMIKRVFGPAAHWIETAPARPDPRDVRYADESFRNGPQRFTAIVIALWVSQLVISILLLVLFEPDRWDVPVRSVVTIGFMTAATFLGAIPFTYPMVSLLTRSTVHRLFGIAHAAGIPLQRERASLRLRLIVLMATTGLAGPLWMASTSYASGVDRAVAESQARARAAAAELARNASEKPGDAAALTPLIDQASNDEIRASIVDRAGSFVAGEYALSQPLAEWFKSGADTWTSRRGGLAAARVPTSNGLFAIAVAQVTDWASSSLVWTLVAYFVVIIAWVPICAYFLAKDVVDPLEEMTRTVIQVTEIGKLDEVATIAVTQNDELGMLGSRFNELLDTLRDLSAAARALAKGDLEARLEGEGDVATAFRAMINSLGQIVRQIHETSVLLAAAATEIYAASQEQEAAAASQSTAMVEIRQTMESLFEAAAHVSESVRGVLSNAERTLETTDRMVIRIGDLTTHAGRIGEILETIRDISDRSDLLALNGALEASRAGEAGRGFGLVAAEMRRLAERVMTSVHDVRSLVGDIRASGSSTMMATEDSKKLAASTTDAARQITLVTQQQRSGTEQVLQSVREIAETLTQSVAAMAQTRASAEQLKSQADKLSSLVQAFRIETPPT